MLFGRTLHPLATGAISSVFLIVALAALMLVPELVITDFVKLRECPCPQRNLVDGDARCATVAAASIIAKVTRDRIMLEMDQEFPEYGFVRHKGYATPEHIAAIDRHGLCPLHRRSFVSAWRQGSFVFEVQTTEVAPATPRA